MSTAPSNDPNAKSVPPDPGGRSRFLVRGIAIACIALAVIAVVLLIGLKQTAPPAKPGQPNDGSGRSSVTAPKSPRPSPCLA
ncbi:hypothetical protein [Terriglobus sp.]|uniref:hypothetical protein n=1 Tax=Terriglobus sp. TaxID=1889013 RepID=UPI003AFFE901